MGRHIHDKSRTSFAPYTPSLPLGTKLAERGIAWCDLQVAQARDGSDLLFVGMDLAPLTLWCAYGAGLFPMGVGHLIQQHGSVAEDDCVEERGDAASSDRDDPSEDDGPHEDIGWFCPDPRGIVEDCEAHVSRSTRRVLSKFSVTVNRAFGEVMSACGDEQRGDQWITPEFIRAYGALHTLGVAHSIEVWHEGKLAGGLYGVQHGGLFAGESMFHHVTGASKVALIAATLMVKSSSAHPLFDVQWQTDHLASQGVIEVSRDEYLLRLREARSTVHGTLARFDGLYQLFWQDGEVALRDVA